MILTVVQVVLAVLYVIAGLWKITGETAALEQAMPGFSMAVVRLIGVVEVLAALGLALPLVVRKQAKVAGWASVVLAGEAAVFAIYHLLHQAYLPAGATGLLGLLAALVAWRRL